jgi:hypothetical protein
MKRSSHSRIATPLGADPAFNIGEVYIVCGGRHFLKNVTNNPYTHPLIELPGRS